MRRHLLAACLIVFAGCNDAEQTAPFTSELPQAALLDGAHTGNPHFFLLPPLVKQPSYSGTFDPSLLPNLSVQICDWNGSACGSSTAVLTAQGSGAAKLRIEDDHYAANWETRGFASNRTYRARFVVAGNTLGFADIKLVDNASQLKGVDANQFVGAVAGSTVPLKFRVEVGAVVVIDPAKGGTVTAPGGSVTLTIPAGATSTTTAISVESVPSSNLPAIPDSISAPMGSTIYEFGPDGTTFSSPVTLTIAYNPATVPQGVNAADLLIYSYSPSTGSWQSYKPVVDTVAHTLTTQITHFSWWFSAPPVLSYVRIFGNTLGETGYGISANGVAYDQNNNQLSASISATTDNPAVMEIHGGYVIMKQPGSATLTVTASYNGKSVSASETISAFQAVHSLTLSADTARVIALNSTTARIAMRAYDGMGAPIPDAGFFNSFPSCGSLGISRDTVYFAGPSVCTGQATITAYRYTPFGYSSASVPLNLVVVGINIALSTTTHPVRPHTYDTVTVNVTPAIAGVGIGITLNGANLGFAYTDANGVARTQIAVVPFAAGTYQAQVQAYPDSRVAFAASGFSLTVLKAFTYTTASVAPGAMRRDQPLTFQAATVWHDYNQSTYAGGDVQFSVDGVALATLPAGQWYTFTPSNLKAGPHTLTTTFLANQNFESSTASVPFNLAPAPSSLAFGNAAGTYGTSVNLSATVSPAAAGRTVTFARGGTTLGSAQTDASGTASIAYNITDAAGATTLTASVPADTFYASAAQNATLTVSKASSTISTADQSGAYGSAATLSAQTNVGAGATVNFSIDGTAVGAATTDNNGAASLSYNIATTKGAHVITAAFGGNSFYDGSTATGTLTVTAAQLTIGSSVASGVIRSFTTATAQLTPAVSGVSVRFTEAGGGTVTTQTDASGHASAQLAILEYSAGSYAVTVEAFPGDFSDYASGSTTVVVNKANSTVTGTVYAPAGQLRRDLPLTLVGQALFNNFIQPTGATGTVSFKIDGVDVGSAQTNTELTFTPSQFHAGTHTLETTFLGNDGTNSSTSSTTFTLAGAASTITFDDLSGTYGSPVNLSATVSPASPGRTVTFKRGSTTLGSAITDANGTATFAYTIADAPGTVTLTAAVPNDTLFYAADDNAVLTVAQAASTTTVSDQSSAYGASTTLSAQISPASTGNVDFTIDGNAVGSATADNNGVAQLAYTVSVAAGTHTIAASFGGNTYSAGSSGSGTLTVAKATQTGSTNSVSVTYGASATFSAHVSPARGGAQVQFRVGAVQIGSGTTDAQGNVSVTAVVSNTVTPGSYTYNADVAEDAFGLPASFTNSLTINKAALTLSASNVSGDAGAQVQLTGTLAPAAAGRTISFTVLGTTVTAVTDANGVATASFTIPSAQAPGDNTINASFDGDPIYLPASASATLTVNKQSTTLSAAGASTTVGSATTLSATLSPAFAGASINFAIGSTSLGTATTNSSGVATLNYTPSSAGSFTYTTSYAGDGSHAASSGNATLTVNKGSTSISLPFLQTSPGTTMFMSATLSPAMSGKSLSWVVSDETTGATLASGTGQTNSSGTIFFQWQTPNVIKRYDLTVRFNGDGNYNSSVASEEIFVRN